MILYCTGSQARNFAGYHWRDKFKISKYVGGFWLLRFGVVGVMQRNGWITLSKVHHSSLTKLISQSSFEVWMFKGWIYFSNNFCWCIWGFATVRVSVCSTMIFPKLNRVKHCCRCSESAFESDFFCESRWHCSDQTWWSTCNIRGWVPNLLLKIVSSFQAKMIFSVNMERDISTSYRFRQIQIQLQTQWLITFQNKCSHTSVHSAA